MSLNIELARHNMVEQQVRPWEVLDSRVLEALTAVRREDFVPAAHRNLAFADLSLPLAHGEFMMKPVVEGRVLQSVLPARTESVLEIGTGAGFLTACLARLAANVHSIEQHVDLAEAARARLQAARVANATVEVAEAVNGFAPKETYDGIETFTNILAIVQKNYVDEVQTKQLIEGAIHGNDLETIYREMIAMGRDEILARGLVMFVALIPLFMVRELGRTLGEGALFSMFFRERAAAPSGRSG